MGGEVVRDDADRGAVGRAARIDLSAARVLAVPLRRRLTPHRRSSPTEQQPWKQATSRVRRQVAGHVPPVDAAAGQQGDREAIHDVLFAAASLSRL